MKLTLVCCLALAAMTAVPAQAQKKAKKAKKQAAATVVPAQQIPAAVDGKTFSFAMGVAQGVSLKQYLVAQMGVDSAYVKYAMEGMNATIDDDARKRAEAYAAGLPLMNKQACGKEDSTYIDAKEFERGLTLSVLGQAPLEQDSAMKVVEQQFKHQQETFKLTNLEWLEANKKLKGVKTLPSGLQYRVLTEGNGPVATDSSEVEVHYEGSLIDGTVFDSSYKRGQPATFRCNQVIKGWTEALQLMPEGSTWELYIPYDLAYGERGNQSIPPYATLIFKVEVLKVKTPESTKPGAAITPRQ